MGDPIGEAYALHGLGLAHLRGGDYTEAGAALTNAQELATSNGERLIQARIECSLAELALACGKPPQAVVHLHRALSLSRAIRAPLFEARVLTMLGEAYAAADGTGQPVTDPARADLQAWSEAGWDPPGEGGSSAGPPISYRSLR